METDIPTLLAAALVARLYLGGFLVLSALGKLRNLSNFVDGTIAYQILPPQVAKLFALLLPWVELGIAALLLSGLYLRLVSLLTILLLLCFIVAIAVNLRQGRQIPCSCYGLVGTDVISWGTVVRNLFLVVLALIVAVGAPNSGGSPWGLESVYSPYIMLVLIVTLLACCYLATGLLEAGVRTHLMGRRVSS